jgi:hypothetical protein
MAKKTTKRTLCRGNVNGRPYEHYKENDKYYVSIFEVKTETKTTETMERRKVNKTERVITLKRLQDESESDYLKRLKIYEKLKTQGKDLADGMEETEKEINTFEWQEIPVETHEEITKLVQGKKIECYIKLFPNQARQIAAKLV